MNRGYWLRTRCNSRPPGASRIAGLPDSFTFLNSGATTSLTPAITARSHDATSDSLHAGVVIKPNVGTLRSVCQRAIMVDANSGSSEMINTDGCDTLQLQGRCLASTFHNARKTPN